MLAIVLFVDGVTRVIIAFKMKPVKGWGWMLAGGVVSVLLAWMIGREFPVSGLWVVGTMAGISLLFSGFTTISLVGTARKVAGAAEGLSLPVLAPVRLTARRPGRGPGDGVDRRRPW